MLKDAVKERIALYYGEDAKSAKEQAAKLRSEGKSVTLIQASAFQDLEGDVNSLRFTSDVDGATQRRIEDAYEDAAQKTVKVTAPLEILAEIEIPEDWAELSWVDQQKIAAAISGEAVRSKAEAGDIIETEVKRRQSVLGDGKGNTNDGEDGDRERIAAEKGDLESIGEGTQSDGTADEGDDETEDAEDEGTDGDETDDPDFETMTKKQLIASADEHAIDLGDASRKEDILEKVRNASE